MKSTAVILAGGKNLRLGRSKALEVINGKSLIERVVERLQALADRLYIVTSPEQTKLLAVPGVEVLTDVYPGRGPLGGIYTGLLGSGASEIIAVACDMPFLNTELLGHMVEISHGFDAVVPRMENGMIEPLHSVYSRSCLEAMKSRLENNLLSITRFLKEQQVRYIEEAECRRFDPDLLTFFNINDESDLEKATRLVEERGY
jgi:molybdopterin-guanine dinucleotide biosynthesis protein A